MLRQDLFGWESAVSWGICVADDRTQGASGHGTTCSLFRVASRVVYRTPAAMLDEHAFFNQPFDGVFRGGLADGAFALPGNSGGPPEKQLRQGPSGSPPRRIRGSMLY